MSWQTWRDQFNFPTWNLVCWMFWASQFAVLEFLGVKYPEHYATLTYLSKHAVPRFALAMFLGWLTWHFLTEATR